jgi:hypothetical protein
MGCMGIHCFDAWPDDIEELFMTKYTINELANSKGVSPLVREALLQMEAELEATNRQVEILSDALAESRREVAAKDQALDLALEALEYIDLCDNDRDFLHPHECFQLDEAITAIKQALALDKKAENARELGLDYEPVHEPVAWMVDVDLANYQGQSEYRTILAWNAKPVWSGTHEVNEVLKAVPLYTTPPAQEFVCSTGLCHYKATSEKRECMNCAAFGECNPNNDAGRCGYEPPAAQRQCEGCAKIAKP